MPISGMTDREVAFPQIGNIRKGDAKPESGDRPGKDLSHFRVEFDEREREAQQLFDEIYKEAPTEITVVMPFDEIGRVWDAWREAYVAGALIHRCDGDYVQYAIDAQTGEAIVRNGINEAGDRVPCTLKNVKDKARRCKPTGRLSVIIPALKRLAYLVVHTTSSHDIINISRQLEAIRAINGGHIAGIPLVLKRKPYKISTPTDNGKRVRREKWLLSVEADPEWVSAKIDAMRAAALPTPNGGGLVQLPAPAVSGDIVNGFVLPVVTDDDDEEDGDFSAESGTLLPTQNGNRKPASPAMLARWGQLVAEATKRGLTVEVVPGDIDADELAKRGKALRAQLEGESF